MPRGTPGVLCLREWDAPPAVAQAPHPRARREAVARTLDDGNAALLELGPARLGLAFQLTLVQLVLHCGGKAPSVAGVVQRTGEPFGGIGQLREQQRRRVVDGPAGKLATHFLGEVQQGSVIADLLCRRAGEGGDLIIADAQIEQVLIGGGGLERLQILAVQVLHGHRLAALDIAVAAHHRWEGAQSGESRGGEASLPGDELVAPGVALTHGDRLHQPDGADGLGKPSEIAEILAMVSGRDCDVVERHLDQLGDLDVRRAHGVSSGGVDPTPTRQARRERAARRSRRRA
jgi:hypothetical protein